MEKQTSDFEALWQKAQSEPQVKKVQTSRVEVNLTIDEVMTRYAEAAREAASQNKIGREALEEINKHVSQFKSTLSQLEKTGAKGVTEIQRMKKRLLDRFS